MFEEEKLTTVLQLVRDAKKTINETMESVSGEQGKVLEKLSTCIENIEGDLVASALDEKIAKLQGYKKELESVNTEIKENMKELKAVSDKVAMAGEALGKLIAVISKVAALPGF